MQGVMRRPVQSKYDPGYSIIGYHGNGLYGIGGSRRQPPTRCGVARRVAARGVAARCVPGAARCVADAETPCGRGENGLVTEPWMIDELAYAGPEHLDPAFVAGYDRKQGFPDPGEDLAIFEAHGLGRTSAVLDLGAGSGQFALAAARRFGHVTAVDVSPVMVALLGERAAAAGLANMDCVQAGFLSYEHSGPPVAGVYTRNALHQLPDFWKAVALDRIAAMMRPGGVLRLHDLIYDFSPAQAAGVFQDWFDHAASDPAAGYTGADYAEHIRTEFSTFRWLLEPILAATGFQIVTAEYDRRLYGAYTCLRRDA